MPHKLSRRRTSSHRIPLQRRAKQRLRGIEELEQRQMMDATLVADIRAGTADSVPSSLTDRDGTQFFLSANGGPHGRELWISNGSEQGTRLVNDIFPGTNPSNPQHLTMLGSTLFFVADDGVHGDELWKSDGTPASTVMVQDLNPGSNDSNTSQLTVVGDTLFFTAYNGTSWGLYSITERGALLRVEFANGAQRANAFDFEPEQLVAFNGRLYFQGNSPADSGQLWSSDPTFAAPMPWADGATLRPVDPVGLTVVGDKLFFARQEGHRSYSLWTSDGTSAGTARVAANIGFFGTDNFGSYATIAVGSEFYFVSDGELWHSDGSGASQIDIRPGADASNPRNLTDVNGTLFFTANDGVHGVELWTASGDSARMVRDISPDPNVPGARDLYNANGTLYFAGNDGVNGAELWRSDGTVTEMVDDINPGPGSSSPRSFLYQSGTLYFNADDWFIHGSELFKLILGGTTDIILDFNGAEIHAGQGYQIPTINGFDGATFGGFTAFASSDGTPGDRREQTLQIVAAVREDFADYNVRVLWDDRGVNSPHYDKNDTVVMLADKTFQQITGTPLNTGGTSSNVDISQNFRDTSIIYIPTLRGEGTTARQRLRATIDTISHEAGHTLGLSHANETDSEARQIVTNAIQFAGLDSRFSHDVLNHDIPETGVRYAETARLLRNLGATTRGQTDTHTGQTLPLDTPVLQLTNVTTTAERTIDFMGDRDGFQFVASVAGEYTLRQVSQTALLNPTLTAWDGEGDFLAAGNFTSSNNTSELRVTLAQGQTCYLVAGSTFDRLEGFINTDNRGNYRIEIVRPLPRGPVLVNRFAVSRDVGGTSQVTVYEAGVSNAVHNFLAYPGFTGGVRVALGELNGDGIPEIITAAGPGGGPHVRVFDGLTGQQIPGPLGSFYAYHPNFAGGVFVASGDVNGDGRDDIITGAGAGGGPHVRVFSGLDGSELLGFYAYDQRFGGGVSVAAGDVNGDGRDDIITGAGLGGGPHVRIFSGAGGAELRGFFAYDDRFTGGVNVAAGDTNGDGRDDVYVGPGAGGGPHVRVISGANGAELQGFFAYEQRFTGGVRVAAVDINADGRSDIVTAPGAGGGAHLRALNGVDRAELWNFMYHPTFTGGLFVAGGPISQVNDALQLASHAPAAGGASLPLSAEELETLRAAAVDHWAAAGLSDAGLDLLNHVRLEIVDLPGNLLGLTRGDVVQIDRDAAGRGWFVDPTPEADEEFSFVAEGHAVSPGALDRVDLLSVVLHELGHVLGLEHEHAANAADDLMRGELGLGQRRLPTSRQADDLFAQW